MVSRTSESARSRKRTESRAKGRIENLIVDCTSDSELERLRHGVTKEQRRALNCIRAHIKQDRRDKPGWPAFTGRGHSAPKRRVHQDVGGRTLVEKVLTELGGSIVVGHARSSIESERYVLTLLGTLLTNDGPVLATLLFRYLEYWVERFRADPDIENVTSSDVQTALTLSADDLGELLGLLQHSDCPWGSVGNISAEQWIASIPHNIEEIEESPNIPQYVDRSIVSQHDPNCPVDGHEMLQYLARRARSVNQSTAFGFVASLPLRTQLDSDWNEAQEVHKAKAYKATAVLCGGIIEGLLLSALQPRKDEALAYRTKLKEKDELEKWRLESLVVVAEAMGLVKSATAHLGHAIREYRNLIHPGRHIREGTAVDRQQADIAINVVKLLSDELRALDD